MASGRGFEDVNSGGIGKPLQPLIAGDLNFINPASTDVMIFINPASTYTSAVQPAARGPHAARRPISCGPPVLAKFVRNLDYVTNKVKDKNFTSHFTIS